MTASEIETRLTAVERELAELKAQIASRAGGPNQWVEAIAGSFANDPMFDQAMRLGRKWRKSQANPGRRTTARRKSAK